MVEHVAYEIWKDGKRDDDALTYQDLTVADCADGYEARPLVYLSDYAKLEAENERLNDQRVLALQADVDRFQALSRTGAAKVKALDEDDYEEIVSAAAINMRKATSGIRGQVITVQDSLDWWVMKETERRILSTLEPAASEGEQEVAGAVRVCPVRDAICPHGMDCLYNDGMDCDMEASRADLAYQKHAASYTRPAEQAVTDEMVARASAEYQVIFGKYLLSSHARRILKAAMEAGRDV